jgi:hypothetical protein
MGRYTKRLTAFLVVVLLLLSASPAPARDNIYVYVNDTVCRSFYLEDYAMMRLGASISPRMPTDAGTLRAIRVIWQHWQRHRSPSTTGDWGPWKLRYTLIEVQPEVGISYPFEHRWQAGDDADDRFRLGMVTRYVLEGAPDIRIALGNLATYRGALEGCVQLPAGYRIKR